MNVNWENLYEENGSALMLYARQFAESLADAEDAVQEGFLKVLRSSSVAEGVPLRPLLFKAVRWAALDRRRSRKRQAIRETIGGEDPGPACFHTTLESQEQAAQLDQCLKTLPLEQREVLTMKIWGEMTFKEIAEALGVPPGTVASRYRYGIEALKKVLESESSHERDAIGF